MKPLSPAVRRMERELMERVRIALDSVHNQGPHRAFVTDENRNILSPECRIVGVMVRVDHIRERGPAPEFVLEDAATGTQLFTATHVAINFPDQ